MSDEVVTSANQLNRRELGKFALSAAVGAAALGWPQSSSAADGASSSGPSGIKVGCAGPADPKDDDLLFLKQIGVDCVNISEQTREASVEGILKIRKRYADVGIIVNNAGNVLEHTSPDILLNRPGRDQAIEAYKTWIRTMAKAGMTYTRWDHTLAQAVESGLAETRGGNKTRDFDLSSPKLTAGESDQKVTGSANTPAFGREYSRDEILANYAYFMKQVVPVAEEVGMKIGFHPDDPPIASLFGVPRIFNNFEACKKALEIANSPNVGMCLCCGTWAEGGATMGIDPAGAIRYFGSKKQLFEIHFRNVSSPLPHFHETFPDEGYYDQYKIMKALADVKFNYTATLDHWIPMPGGRPMYEAYALGYMRALRQVAQSGTTA